MSRGKRQGFGLGKPYSHPDTTIGLGILGHCPSVILFLCQSSIDFRKSVRPVIAFLLKGFGVCSFAILITEKGCFSSTKSFEETRRISVGQK